MEKGERKEESTEKDPAERVCVREEEEESYSHAEHMHTALYRIRLPHYRCRCS